MRFFFLPIFLSFIQLSFAQGFVTRDIKSFGAVGNGKTNDHEAFQRAAFFFNQRGGNGRLIISKGTYLVGKQTFNRNTKQGPLYEGEDLLKFTKVKNLVIEGANAPVITYRSGLRFGSFHPKTGEVFTSPGNFYDYTHAAIIKNAIELQNCESITIRNLEIDGNNRNIILGGQWGDVGRQLPHTGLLIGNSTNITVTNINIHHFGLDGMILSNATGGLKKKDAITISNSRFEYNGRQGFSWVGGNDLTVIKSAFNHTGKGQFMSSPGAGVDIEAEVGTVSNGKFIDCEFINNSGCGLLAEDGPSSDCLFVGCLFWGVDLWSVWVRKPRFQFDNCTFHGSVVHGFSADNNRDATVFRNSHFEDKPYKGREAYGNFLVESNYVKRMRFDNCTFIANNKRPFWMVAPDNSKPDERYHIVNSRLVFKGEAVVLNDHLQTRNTTFEVIHPETKKKTVYYTDSYGVLKKR